MARARPTRWRWPPDSWAGLAVATSWGSPTIASASSTFDLRAWRPMRSDRRRSSICSPTVSHGVSEAPASWKTIWGLAPLPNSIDPSSTGWSPAIDRSNVDLPHPLSPTRATASPSLRARSTPRRACSWRFLKPEPTENRLCTPCTSTAGALPSPMPATGPHGSAGLRATAAGPVAMSSSRMHAT